MWPWWITVIPSPNLRAWIYKEWSERSRVLNQDKTRQLFFILSSFHSLFSTSLKKKQKHTHRKFGLKCLQFKICSVENYPLFHGWKPNIGITIMIRVPDSTWPCMHDLHITSVACPSDNWTWSKLATPFFTFRDDVVSADDANRFVIFPEFQWANTGCADTACSVGDWERNVFSLSSLVVTLNNLVSCNCKYKKNKWVC